MAASNQKNSRFKFWGIDITFTNEKRWEKFLWIGVSLSVLIIILLIIGRHMPSVLTIERVLSVKFLVNYFKGRSP